MTLQQSSDWTIEFVDDIAKNFIGGGDYQDWLGIKDLVRQAIIKHDQEYEAINWLNGRTDISEDQKRQVEGTYLLDLAIKLNNKLQHLK